MYKETINQITVMTILDRRLKRKSGLYPVRVQVVYKRIQKYFNTGKEMSEDMWGKLPDGKSKEMITSREKIKGSYNLILQNVETLAVKGEFSFEKLNMRLGRISTGTLDSIFEMKIKQLKEEERIGSMFYYQNILNSIEHFAGKQISLENITVDWLKKFENQMLKNNLSYTTIAMRMRGIRSIINTAMKEGLVKQSGYPFGKGKYEIKTAESIKKALTLEQMSMIAIYSDGNETTAFYRDLWLFIYLCNGINVADLVKLRYSNIFDGEICFIREKTKRTSNTIKHIRAVITPDMQAIINRWGNEAHSQNYIFNLINYTEDPIRHVKEVKDLTKRINKRMKSIGKELGIGTITTYTARHSYATVLKRSGVSISYISESLGHSDLRTTESYLASFEKNERMKNANVLTLFRAEKQESNK